MICRKCGKEVQDGKSFCQNCGNNLLSEPKPKAAIDLWLILTIISILLLILSISMGTIWGDVPLNRLDVEETLPSALLGIGAIGVSGFGFFNEKKQKDSKQGNQKKFVISLLIFIACAFMGFMFCFLPFLGALK